MNNTEISDAFAAMWRQSRADADVSQAQIAKALGVSKSTVQHWEDGTSCPSQIMGFKWFQALDLQPLPYYLKLLYPSEMDIKPSDSDEKITDALITLIKAMPSHYQRELLYLLHGDHGSSPVAMLEMITAHLQAPLRDRVNIAASIANNYEIATARGTITKPNSVQPDMQRLYAALGKGKQAAMMGLESYTSLIDEGEL